MIRTLLSMSLVVAATSASAFSVCSVFTDLEPSTDVPTNVAVFMPSASLMDAVDLVFESDTDSVMAEAAPLDVDYGPVVSITLDEPLQPNTAYDVYAVTPGGLTPVGDVTTTDGPDDVAPEPVSGLRVRGERGRGGSTNDPWSQLAVEVDEPPPRGGYLEIQASEDGTFDDPYIVLSGDERLVFGSCGSDLQPGESYSVRVRVVDAAGQASEWSQTQRERFPNACGCSSVPTPLAWMMAMPVVMLVRRRRVGG